MKRPHYTVEAFRAGESLGYLIRRLHNLVMPRAEALFEEAEFTFSQWVVLMAVRDGVASRCADLARMMEHDAGATTRLVDQMEERGLIRRRRSTTDRRVVHLEITAAGKAVAKTMIPRIVNFWNEVLEDFSSQEFAQLVTLLTRLAERIELEPASGRSAKKGTK
ncbi:MAG TPA: MarR family winged helix-turn-helix transcriptional regulator [Rhizomicrobium sp.]|jgi:DNA-binding MarR family transcriptional regulator